MTLSFDQVVPRLIENVVPTLPSDVRVLVVRTLEGRVRLCLRHAEGVDLPALEAQIGAVLGAWLSGPVIAAEQGPPSLRAVARLLWERADVRSQQQPDWQRRWPPGWPVAYHLPGLTRVELEGRWEAEQVAHGKEPWMAPAPAQPPWPMVAKAPKITAFYGFKGGVGRTTTLAVLARRLAGNGAKVLCVDLDLEAPGLGRVLEGDDPPDEGLLDYLVQHAVTGAVDMLPVREIEVHGARLLLAGAGALGDTYVEKLSRLDTLHREGGLSPVHAALEAFLRAARKKYKPDHILLDCRAGLHDLAGLALHDLAHVDVLVGRGDRQELDGLRTLLRRLIARRKEPDRRLLVLRTLHRLPIDNDRVRTQRLDLYDIFRDVVYDDEPPSEDTEGAAHDPCPVGYLDEITQAASLREASLSAVHHTTFDALHARLEALWAPEEP